MTHQPYHIQPQAEFAFIFILSVYHLQFPSKICNHIYLSNKHITCNPQVENVIIFLISAFHIKAPSRICNHIYPPNIYVPYSSSQHITCKPQTDYVIKFIFPTLVMQHPRGKCNRIFILNILYYNKILRILNPIILIDTIGICFLDTFWGYNLKNFTCLLAYIN